MYKLNIYWLLVLLLLVVGCAKDSIKPIINENDCSVFIKILIPRTNLPKSTLTKSGQTSAETLVNQVQILVFENGLYSYKVPAENLTQTDNSATFSARIRSNNVPTTLFIIANNNDVVEANEPAVDTPIDNARSLFNLAYTAASVTGNAAMWGSYTFSAGISNTPLDIAEPILLLRAVARVDIHVAPTAAANFTLETVQVFRAANRLQIIPNNPNTVLSVTSPSIPSGTTFNVNTTPINSTSATVSEAQLYLPESPAPDLANQVSQATCIVIGGRFNNGATRQFYRLDFKPDVDGYPLGQVLRNARYDFTISEVNSNGFGTAIEAANNISAGANAQLFLWTADNIHYMFFDNNNYWGVEKNNIQLQGVINSSAEAAVSTDVASYQLRFADGQPTSWSASLNDGVFSVQQVNGGAGLLFTTLASHFLSTPRQRIVEVRCGNIENIQITLIQEPTEYNGLWSLVNVDMPGTFSSSLNSFGRLYIWNNGTLSYPNSGTVTDWTSSISVSTTWAAQADPCPPGWRIPTVNELNQLMTAYPSTRVYSGTDQANPNQGLWMAPTQAEANSATFQNPGNALFFPFSGTRTSATVVSNVNIEGQYYARDGVFSGGSNLRFMRTNRTTAPTIISQTITAIARPVRCIRAQ